MTVQEELSAAQQAYAEAREAKKAAEVAEFDAYNKLRRAQDAVRAEAWAANATMAEDHYGPFPLSGPVEYRLREGERVHAVPPEHEHLPFRVTRQDGRQFDVPLGGVVMDAPTSAEL